MDNKDFAAMSKEELLQWMSETTPWAGIDKDVANMMVDMLYGGEFMEIFIFALSDQAIVDTLNDIAKEVPADFDAELNRITSCSKFAHFLTGAARNYLPDFSKNFNNPEIIENNPEIIKNEYINLMNFMELAINISPKYYYGYLCLVELQCIIGNNEKALNFCEQGLRQIAELSTVPFPEEMQKSLDMVKESLINLKTEIESRV